MYHSLLLNDAMIINVHINFKGILSETKYGTIEFLYTPFDRDVQTSNRISEVGLRKNCKIDKAEQIDKSNLYVSL